MRNYFILLVLFFATVRCFSQTESLAVERRNAGCWARMDYNINIYADSLNFWSVGNPLPNFLFDAHFDLLNTRFTNDCFIKLQFISFRKAIFDRVVNEEVLRTIVASKDKRLDDRYDPKELKRIQENYPSIHGATYPDLPYMKYSTRELAERRLKELREMKKLFSK